MEKHEKRCVAPGMDAYFINFVFVFVTQQYYL